ncbi:MAG: contact-dependent growth inhibition system immunity protein [Chloroflexota bacterium]|nr:contact-dependent growth inhibition system immunity protein [Chloroflexota bacterium]
MLAVTAFQHIPRDKTNNNPRCAMSEQSEDRELHGLTSADRTRTLKELEGRDWGEPEDSSYLLTTCHRLHRTPVRDFTVGELRIMIGQGIGLPWLVPLALERLEEDPLAEGDYYLGDLLGSVLGIEPRFWRDHPDLRNSIEEIVRGSTAKGVRDV